MATPSQRKTKWKEGEQKSEVGYLFNATDKVMGTGGMEYMYFDVEMENGIKGGICYHMGHERALKSYQQKRSPVKLK